MPKTKSPCEALLWVDVTQTATPLTAQAISHVSGLAQKAGLVYEGFRNRHALSSANSELRKFNQELETALTALRRAQKKLNDDLNQARQLQDGLLPKTVPTQFLRGGAFRYVPAGEVGGDYYDCFQIDEKSLGLVVADVSGHGIAAALIMTMFKVLLKTLAQAGQSPAAILKQINATFCEELDGRHFVTVFLGIFDVETRKLTYSNAGHIPQLLIRQPEAMCDLDMQEMTSQGMVLGMFPDPLLVEDSIHLPEPFRLVLFTDGISEAHGAHNAMFGMDRIRQVIRDTAHADAETAGTQLMNALAVFSGAATPNTIAGQGPEDWEDLADDATLVILDL
jgi:sigma-B regulation protein RsbU (phosphoserine phosphatase)